MRMAPSSRMVSPFSIEFSMMWAASAAYSAGRPRRGGKGTCLPSETRAGSGSPASIGGSNTQTVHVHIPAGIDEHCERARRAGATIESEPEDQFYGDRSYRAVDLEGHRWTFSMTVRQVTRAEAEKALGQPIVATQWA